MRLAELCQFRAPAGFTATVVTEAEKEGVSLSEYLRRLVLAHVEARNADHNDNRQNVTELSVYDGPRGLVTA